MKGLGMHALSIKKFHNSCLQSTQLLTLDYKINEYISAI